MMGAAARFHSNRARRQLGEKLLQLRTPHRTADHNSAGRINTVDRKDVLRQIQANHANLLHGRFPSAGANHITSVAPMMPSGAVHPIIARRLLAPKQSRVYNADSGLLRGAKNAARNDGQLFRRLVLLLFVKTDYQTGGSQFAN
jgi:hypothetical protein